MTKLEGEQKLKRVVRIHAVGEVEVTLSTDGLQFRVPGTRTSVSLSWFKALDSSTTPPNVKSYHMGQPVDLLQSMVEKKEKRNASL